MQSLVERAHCPRQAGAPVKSTCLARYRQHESRGGRVVAVGAKLVVGARSVAPGARLCFTPKPDKDVRALREGGVDLEIGVLGESGPEIRIRPFSATDSLVWCAKAIRCSRPRSRPSATLRAST